MLIYANEGAGLISSCCVSQWEHCQQLEQGRDFISACVALHWSSRGAGVSSLRPRGSEAWQGGGEGATCSPELSPPIFRSFPSL